MTETVQPKRKRGRPPAPKPQAKPVRGRPRYVPAAEQRVMVSHLLAVGETQQDIQKLLGISHPVFLSRFRTEIEDARLRLRASFLAVVFEKALDGNASMLKLALDLTALPDSTDKPYELPKAQPEAEEPKAPKLGKKEQQALAAANPDTSTPMGRLMAERAKRGARVQ
jgi:hypothetical protein